uniref:Putative Sugar binding protein of ABC transporter n=1 Tax=Magnetococcus massalia (strain MO-1) TaxID=451514 RepID=A0A1S7LFH6_MAGMO|nr:putative Sugar binding protein of ABC transporter [Candidatus Magnetococcus massalia]
MRLARLIRHLCAALLLLIPLATAHGAGATAGASSEAGYVFISHAGVSDPFWKIPFRGARDAAKELGVPLTILAPEQVNDYSRQVELLQQAIKQQPLGIATTLSDPHGFSTALMEAKRAGIPVIVFNARPQNDDRIVNPYLAYIGMDDYKAGQAMARSVLQRTEPEGHVLIAVQQAGHAGLEARFAGIVQQLGTRGIEVARLNVGDQGGADAEVRFRDYLKANPGLTTVISLGPESAHPIGRVIKRGGLKLFFASFDLSPLTSRMIKDGIISFTIDQQPYMQGYLSVQMLRLAARYKMIPPDINTGIGVVDANNLEQVEALAKAHIR